MQSIFSASGRKLTSKMANPLRTFAWTVMLLIGIVAFTGCTHSGMWQQGCDVDGPQVPQWDIFEVSLHAVSKGNPFDVPVAADFTSGQTTIHVRGFYDGNDTYRIRFMPPTQGVWRYETDSEVRDLNGQKGEFCCVAPAEGQHGPVMPKNTFHFAYADDKPFVPISTTIYGWVNQRSDELQEQTLASLKASPFNRVRMMVLPIKYGPDNVPRWFPFEKNEDGSWNFDHPDPQYFRHIEQRLAQLREMGIEAELILFHSRDDGLTHFDRMSAEADDRYLRYVVARFSSYSNVWWNLANEFDAMRYKHDDDWDRFFQIIAAEDPVQHPRSVHQMHRYYDVTRDWVTYMSVQNGGAVSKFGLPDSFRIASQKPIIFDEIEYEGTSPASWGHLPPQDMVHRFWLGIVAGCFVTHGETLYSAPEIAWISRGGKLMGESPKRIAFLKKIIADAPMENFAPLNPQDEKIGIGGKVGDYYLVYFGKSSPTEWTFDLPASRFIKPGTKFKIDIIDTWNMTITPVKQLATIPAPPPPPPSMRKRRSSTTKSATTLSTTQTAEQTTRPTTTLATAPTTTPATAPATHPATQPAFKLSLPGKPMIVLRIQRVE